MSVPRHSPDVALAAALIATALVSFPRVPPVLALKATVGSSNLRCLSHAWTDSLGTRSILFKTRMIRFLESDSMIIFSKARQRHPSGSRASMTTRSTSDCEMTCRSSLMYEARTRSPAQEQTYHFVFCVTVLPYAAITHYYSIMYAFLIW